MTQFSNYFKEWWLLILILLIDNILNIGYVEAGTEEDAKKWLATMETKFNQVCNKKVLVDWELGINANSETKKKSVCTQI